MPLQQHAVKEAENDAIELNSSKSKLEETSGATPIWRLNAPHKTYTMRSNVTLVIS